MTLQAIDQRLSRIERALSILAKEEKAKPKTEWVTAKQMKTRFDLTDKQLEYFRTKNPLLFKKKVDSPQYLYNATAYASQLQ